MKSMQMIEKSHICCHLCTPQEHPPTVWQVWQVCRQPYEARKPFCPAGDKEFIFGWVGGGVVGSNYIYYAHSSRPKTNISVLMVS